MKTQSIERLIADSLTELRFAEAAAAREGNGLWQASNAELRRRLEHALRMTRPGQRQICTHGIEKPFVCTRCHPEVLAQQVAAASKATTTR